MSVSQFIEIKRVTKDKSGTNVLKDETILIEDIKSFRPWFKNDQEKREIKGEVTMLIMKGSIEQETPTEGDKEKGDKEKKKANSLLINESYNDFLTRMRAFVIVR